MTPTPLKKTRRYNAGFTIVELLIATTLGLLILIAVVNIFISSRQSYRTQEGLSQIQETGRLLNYLMYPYIRLAGYLPNPIKQTDPSVTFTSTTRAIGGTENDSTDVSVKDTTDTITVRYRGQNMPGTTTADGSITNCAGVRGTAGVSATDLVEAKFYVSNATNGISDLRCDVIVTAADGTVTPATRNPQPILESVQDLQILYGVGAIDGSTLDRVTQRYYTAATVPDWTAVTSVRLTVTVDNIEKNVAQSTTAVTDRRLRRTFTSTLQIRNRLN